jgi:hypothetical protein
VGRAALEHGDVGLRDGAAGPTVVQEVVALKLNPLQEQLVAALLSGARFVGARDMGLFP